MGFSSWSSIILSLHSNKVWIEYFIKSLNIFLNELSIKEYYLAGHSLGAYISVHLFKENSKFIKKLILISPAGFNPVNKDFLEKRDTFLDN